MNTPMLNGGFGTVIQNPKKVVTISTLDIKSIPYVETLSIAALKANLHYYERLKMKAFEAHRNAIVDAHKAMTALNNALLRKNCNG